MPCFASVVYFALLTLGLTACSAPLSGPRRPDSAVNAGPRALASADAPVTDTPLREGGVADTSDDVEVEAYDPWEGWNTKAFEFNRRVDRYGPETRAQRCSGAVSSARSASSSRRGSTGFTRCRSKPASRAMRMSSLRP